MIDRRSPTLREFPRHGGVSGDVFNQNPCKARLGSMLFVAVVQTGKREGLVSWGRRGTSARVTALACCLLIVTNCGRACVAVSARRHTPAPAFTSDNSRMGEPPMQNCRVGGCMQVVGWVYRAAGLKWEGSEAVLTRRTLERPRMTRVQCRAARSQEPSRPTSSHGH